MNRKVEREQAFILLFEKCFSNESLDDIILLAEESRDFTITEYILNTFKGVHANLDSINNIISKYSKKNYELNRISKVVLSILRLAIYEIKYIDDIPSSVSINEAVELSKKYGHNQDASYVNGLLGEFVRSE